jgi:hypothetical protein
LLKIECNTNKDKADRRNTSVSTIRSNDMSRLKSTGKILLISITLGLIGFIDYADAFDRIEFDVVTREFYFLPILLSAVWFGPRGGLLVSLCSVYVYMPAVLLKTGGTSAFWYGHLLEAVALVSLGPVAAILKEAPGLQFSARVASLLRRKLTGKLQPLLLCLDEPQKAVEAAHSLLRNFELDRKVRITIMGVLHDPERERFESYETFYRAVQNEEAHISNALSEAIDVLVKGGVSRDRVRSQVFRVQTKSAIRDILRAQQFSDYDTILIGSSRLKRSAIPLRDRSGRTHRLPRFLPTMGQVG